MENSWEKTPNLSSHTGAEGLTSRQTAKYTQDMLDSLGKIAARQHQDMLVRLLEAASIEAGRLAVPKNIPGS